MSRAARRWRPIAGVALATALVLVALTLVIRNSPAAAAGVRKEIEVLPSSKLRHATAIALAWLAPGRGFAAATGPLPPPPPTVIGVNASGIQWYESAMPFANLMMGSAWRDDKWGNLDERYQDRDGNLLSLPAGAHAHRYLSLPPTEPKGIEVRCTWTGSGTVTLAGGGETLAAARGSLRVHVVRRHDSQTAPYLDVTGVDAKRPLRDLDCREATVAPTVRFRPEYLRTLRGFPVLRFMDWQRANFNEPVTWATRHLPASTRIDAADGVAIEDMVALVRELGTDAWFVMPWNADDAYITGFARMVAAALPPGRHVYVETGNEVWNGQFPVARQAVKEGRERNLGPDDHTAGMRRYAQRTGEVMRLWEAAFAGRPGLVRVLATQQGWPDTAEVALAFADTARHIDALSTSAYFGVTLGGTGHTREGVLAQLSAAIAPSLEQARANRRIAIGYGKRYIAYEGGEGLVLFAEPQLLEQLQRDPVQLELSQRFFAGWRREIGDLLCLYTSSSRPQTAGAWGLAGWEDDTPADAPKLAAARAAAAGR